MGTEKHPATSSWYAMTKKGSDRPVVRKFGTSHGSYHYDHRTRTLSYDNRRSFRTIRKDVTFTEARKAASQHHDRRDGGGTIGRDGRVRYNRKSSRKSRKVLTKGAALALAAATRTAKVQLHLCVRAVLVRTKKKDAAAVARAFAICTASLQKNGYLRKGSNEPTVKGKARSTLMKNRKDTLDKLAEFEQILARAGVDRRKMSRRSRRSRK